jgi:AcrR family transcriptional regulator
MAQRGRSRRERTCEHAGGARAGDVWKFAGNASSKKASLFLSKGYAGASVNELVRCAGGSLATLYSKFGSEEGLFAAIMRRRASRVFDYEVLQFGQAKGQAQEPRRARRVDRAGHAHAGSHPQRRQHGALSYFHRRRAVLSGAACRILEVIFPTFLQHLAAALTQAGVATGKDGALRAEEFLSLVHGQLVFRAACGGAEAIADTSMCSSVTFAGCLAANWIDYPVYRPAAGLRYSDS